MIVCSCNVLSDHEVRDVVTASGSQSLTAHQVYGCLGCTMQCGRCARAIKRILNETPADCAGGCADCPASRPVTHPSTTSRERTPAFLPLVDACRNELHSAGCARSRQMTGVNGFRRSRAKWKRRLTALRQFPRWRSTRRRRRRARGNQDQKSSGKVHNNRCAGASDHDPLEWMISRLVDFHVRQPSRNMNKVALARDRTEFSMLSPPHVALSLEHVCNGFLLSVMVMPVLLAGSTIKSPPHSPVFTPADLARRIFRGAPKLE
jgi:bacterioferritin-associated ferredoxin